MLPAPLTTASFTQAVLARNADVEAMRQAVLAAVAHIRPAGAWADPMLSVSTAPRTFGSAMGAGSDIEISQALPWWGTLDVRKQEARAEAEAATHDLEALRLRLAAIARGAFSDWVFVHRALEINAANRSVIASLRRIASVRYASGRAPQEDVLQADVERTLLEQQQLEWQRRISVVQARMNALLDRAPDLPIPAAAELPQPLPVPPEAALLRRALAQPRLEALVAEERAAEARERLARKRRYPEFRVSAGYNSMWPDPAMRPMVGLSFTLPIDQGKYRADIDGAHARALQANAHFRDRRAALLAALSASYASTREAAQSVALYRDDLVPLARDTLQVALSEYGSGQGSFLQVLTAEQRQLDSELALARAQSDYFRQLATLERLSGGGWRATSASEGGR
ncbi:MAG: TolC family protein [Proteobacteria bacterium]|nr:TolC family protein [Pseudomonadota bacterium]